MASLLEIILGGLIKVGIEAVGNFAGAPRVIDVVGDGHGTGIPGICIVHLETVQFKDNTYLCQAHINCAGDITYFPLDCVENGMASITVDPLGSVAISFSDWKSFQGDIVPFPAYPRIALGPDIASAEAADPMDIFSFVGSNNNAEGKDCDGHDVEIKFVAIDTKSTVEIVGGERCVQHACSPILLHYTSGDEGVDAAATWSVALPANHGQPIACAPGKKRRGDKKVVGWQA